MDNAELEAIRCEALHAEHGVEVTTTDREAFKRRIYAFIGKAKKNGDESYYKLAIKRSGLNKDAVVLINKEILNGQSERHTTGEDKHTTV